VLVDVLNDPFPAEIELRLLRYFLAVAGELHFGRAAERLGITQPPLSTAIKQLEAALGVELLTRTSRRVALTEAGAVFAHEAAKVLTSVGVAVDECKRTAARIGLRLGWPPDLPLRRAQAFVRGVRERDSDLRVETRHLRSREQLVRLHAGSLDLAVVYARRSDPAIEMEPLFRGEPLIVLLPVGHPLAGRDHVGPAELSNEVLITAPRADDPVVHDHVMAAIREAGYRFRDMREASGADPRDVLLAAADGGGIVVAPGSTIEVLSEARQIATAHLLNAPAHMPDTMLAWRSDPSTRLAAALRNAVAVSQALYA
jgi:DNA-binding transcriptional LysR family regulator